MQTPESAAEGENEVEITDLVSPTGTGKIPMRFASRRKVGLFQTRAWMSIAIIVGIALLVFTVLLNVLHMPKAARVSVQPVQINYPVSLSVVDGICYASALNGVVTAFRVKDGVLIWRHVGRTTSEESVTGVDGVIYLAPILPHGSPVTSMAVELEMGSHSGLAHFQQILPKLFSSRL